MKFIEVTGKSVDEAIENALRELNITRDRAIIDIIDEGSRGFLSFIGNKPAKVKVTVKRDYIEEAYNFVRSVRVGQKQPSSVKRKSPILAK